MESDAGMGDGVICDNDFPVHIGRLAVVSLRARLAARRRPQERDALSAQTDFSICIEPHAWVMAEATVESGVTVGEGAVLGARAIANESLTPWGVYVGNPARLIHSRDKDGYLATVNERGTGERAGQWNAGSAPSTQSHLLRRHINFANRAKRWAWNLLWTLLARPLPTRNWQLRVRLVNLFGGQVHATVRIDGRTRIWAPWNLLAESGTTIVGDADIYSVERVEIGKNVVIGAGAFLCTASHDYNDGRLPLLAAPIHIGDDATLGADSFLGAGVTVGPSAKVGAGAVVVRDVASGVRVSGNPARPC